MSEREKCKQAKLTRTTRNVNLWEVSLVLTREEKRERKRKTEKTEREKKEDKKEQLYFRRNYLWQK